jgi:lon-related putative ATP-dependent protease
MTSTPPLSPDALCQHCDPEQFSFTTTEQLEDLPGVIGQGRATDAIRFGIGIRSRGYNLYVLGPAGIGKHAAVQHLLEERARSGAELFDWCYVNNFTQPDKPQLLKLPPGRGAALRDDMQKLVEELRKAIPSAFASDDYMTALRQIEADYEKHQRDAFTELRQVAKRQHVNFVEESGEFSFEPLRKGHVVSAEKFEKLPAVERERIEAVIETLRSQLHEILDQHIPRWQKESQTRVQQLSETTATTIVSEVMQRLRKAYQDLAAVLTYLDGVEHDVIVHVDAFRKQPENSDREQELLVPDSLPRRYQLNLLVDNSHMEAAPVVYEDNPSLAALLGRIEHTVQYGTLITDFTQIKAGALQLANGGYLILDASKLLMQPYAWEGLKRVLLTNSIRIESLAQLLSLVSTVSLEPEPIPLDIKVVLLGDRLLYYMLHELDPEFAELFKVAADFDMTLERSPQADQLYARLIATLARKEQLRPLDRAAVAAIIQFSMRQVEDTRKLSMHVRSIADLIQQADFLAGEAGEQTITAAHVQQARDAEIVRNSRSRDHLYESIRRGEVMIDCEGDVIGQVNGMTVIELGNFSYGAPTRITATTRLGEGELVDIERESELGGPIHSKGVFILTSFLGARYSRNVPLSLAASLTFEQSYSGVEGDSASLAELCALLSSLADIPLAQSLGVTGSVSQLGRVQAVGGVNDKIEGFFDVCRQRGLNGRQGAIIPATNVDHLMLRDDVIQAARTGQFSIYAVASVDEAIELLTGMSAGEADDQGLFPDGTFNQRVQARLIELATIRHSFATAVKGDTEGKQ